LRQSDPPGVAHGRKETAHMKRILLLVTVALVMAAIMLVMAMPAAHLLYCLGASNRVPT
jgi:hypothetical protein